MTAQEMFNLALHYAKENIEKKIIEAAKMGYMQLIIDSPTKIIKDQVIKHFKDNGFTVEEPSSAYIDISWYKSPTE